MATDIKEAIRRLIYEFVTEGADDVIKAQEKIASTTTTTDKAALSLEKAFGGLERKYVDTVRHQQDYAKVQDKVNAAVAQNPALQERANAVLAAAAEHFDKLAFNANKGGVASSFLSKAIGVIIGPAGLLGVAMTGVGIAVGYMADKFVSSSTTVEENLKEQERLYNQIKTQIDGKASAEAKAAAQSVGLSQYQDLQNEKKVRADLNKEMEKTLALAQKLATTPTQVGGEMGAAPTGMASLAGFEDLEPAVQKLNAAWAAGLPGLTAFRDELAQIGFANPALTETINQLLKIGETGAGIEQSNLKMQAMRAHLVGIATDAQMAAAGLGSVAQVTVNATMAKEAADAATRQAQATLQIAAAYPGMSIEVAKQLNTLQQQLPVIQATTGAEKMAAQELATQNQLRDQGKTLAEARVLAAQQTTNAEAAVNAQLDQQIQALEREVQLIEARRNGTEATVKAEHAYKDALNKGASALKAAEVKKATAKKNAAQEAAEYEAESEQIIAKANAEGAAIDAAANAAELQATREISQMMQAQNQANARIIGQYNDLIQKIGFASVGMAELFRAGMGYSLEFSRFGNTQTWTTPSGKWSAFDPAGYTSSRIEVEGPSQDAAAIVDKYLGKGGTLQGAIAKALGVGEGGVSVAQQLAGLLPQEQQAGAIEQIIATVSRSPRTLANEMLLKQLNDQLEGLKTSTDSLNSTMQNALSPYYSQDPRTTKLGFRAGVKGNPDWMVAGATNANPLDAILGVGATAPGMANGGSFIVGGGYSATDNRIAQFPVASGEQVVVNRKRQDGSRQAVVHNDNRIIIQGAVDADTLSKLKISRYQQTQRMRDTMSAA